MKHDTCKACGRALPKRGEVNHWPESRHDGLCSASPGNPGCYMGFVDFARAHGVEVRHSKRGFKHQVVAWDREAVQVAFDAWLEAGRPFDQRPLEAPMPF